MLIYYLQLIETEEEQQLFTELYLNHRKQMHYKANQLLKNDDLAEDAVHNAFEGVARHMESLRGRSEVDIRNYLLKAAQNAAINLLKKESRQVEYLEYADPTQVEDAVLEALCERLAEEAVVHAISQIDEPYNTVLYNHFVMDMDQKTVAAVLGRKPDTVRQQLLRGKKQLQELLRKELEVNG